MILVAFKKGQETYISFVQKSLMTALFPYYDPIPKLKLARLFS